MTKVIFDISMSLDGYISAPNDRPGEELGDGGQRLHAWLFDEATETDREVARDDGSSAVRRLLGDFPIRLGCFVEQPGMQALAAVTKLFAGSIVRCSDVAIQ